MNRQSTRLDLLPDGDAAAMDKRQDDDDGGRDDRRGRDGEDVRTEERDGVPGLRSLRNEAEEIHGESDRRRGDRAGEAYDQRYPARDERHALPEAFPQEDVFPPRSREHRPQLAVA